MKLFHPNKHHQTVDRKAKQCDTYTMYILGSLIIACLLIGTGLPFVIDLIIFTLGAFFGLFLIKSLLCKILCWIRLSIVTDYVSGVMLCIIFFAYIYISVEDEASLAVLIAASVMATLLLLTCIRNCYKVIKGDRSPWSIGKASSSVVLVSLIIWFLLGKGNPTNYIDTIKNTADSNNLSVTTAVLDNLYNESVTAGEYETESITYGASADIISSEVDLTEFIDYKLLRKAVREAYQGYDLEHVPLNGKVWYPVGKQNCPVVFIVHGNHTMIVDSYLGYDYIGEHLASKGFVVVLVDENVCNYYIDQGLSHENAARAYLLLQHMKEIKTYNTSSKAGVLNGKLDYSNITLIGHSRGGEAVTLAALYNQEQSYLDHNNVLYDTTFDIRSVIEIAPTVDQYLPNGKKVELKDMNYLLIHGSNDQDVNVFMGIKQYNNISFTKDSGCYKSYVYIAGANHGAFNTMWNTDYTFPRSLLLNSADALDPDEQREVLLCYVTAFLEDTVLENDSYHSFFTSNQVAQQAPDTLYEIAYMDHTFSPIETFDTKSLTKCTASDSVECEVQKLAFERYDGKKEVDNLAAVISAKKSEDASYIMSFENQTILPSAKDYGYLQFDVADYRDEALEENDLSFCEFTIQVVFDDETVENVKLSDYKTIYPPYVIRLYKLQLLESDLAVKKELTTVRIPLSDFSSSKEKEDGKIKEIRFVFDQAEEVKVAIDNIGFAE